MKPLRVLFILILFSQPFVICAQGDTTGNNNSQVQSNKGLSSRGSQDGKKKKNITNQVRVHDSIWMDSIQRMEEKHHATVQLLLDSINCLNNYLNEYSNRNLFLNQQIKDSSERIRELEFLISHQSNIRNNKLFFCRAILESPLYTSYSAENVEHCKEMVSWMGYSKSKDKDVKYRYNTFYPLVEHYKEFTEEIVEFINYTISEFDFSPNRLSEQKKFNERIKRSKYYEYRCKDGNCKSSQGC